MQLNLKLPCTKEEITEQVKHFNAEIKLRQTEIEMLRTGLKHYQSQCDHAGQKTGHNERDGSWGNACPICGYSY